MSNTLPESTTITYNRGQLEKGASNIFEAIAIIGKRSEQLSLQTREELNSKLDEFASHTDLLDEIFENREQIEISKHYEKLPKSTSVAISEWLDGDIFHRSPEKD